MEALSRALLPRAEETFVMGLALYAGACSIAAFFLPAPGALLATGVIFPLAVAWLVLALDGPRNA